MSQSSTDSAVVGTNGEPELRWNLPIVTCALAAILAPGLFRYFGQLWSREYYQFFPFLLAAVLWFAARQSAGRIRLTGADAGRWWFRGVVFIGAEVAIGGAVIAPDGSPLLAYIGYCLLLVLLYDFWPHRSGSASSLACLLPLLIIVRPPLGYDLKLVVQLQVWTTSAVTRILDVIAVDHIRQGNTIEMISGTRLEVAEACSGVQSFYALLFIAAFIGLAQNYRAVHVILLMALGSFWAFAMNVLRVLSVALADHFLGMDLATGWKHEAVGYAAMVLAIPLLLSTDRLVEFLFGGIPDDPRQYRQVNIFVLLWNYLFGSRKLSDEDKKEFEVRSIREQFAEFPAMAKSTLVVSALLVLTTCTLCSVKEALRILQ